MTKGKVTIFILILVGAGIWWAANFYNSSSEGLPPLHTEQVDHGDISQRTVAYGRLEPVQKVTVGSQVSGIVDEIFVDFNSVVERGQVLAQIDPSTFEAEVSSAQAELESAEAGHELAQLRWKRVQELRERQFVSPSEVEEASSTLRQAEAQVQVRRHALQRAQRELDRCTIKSPTDGIVISREVDVGQTVAASLSAPILFELAANLNQMLIHANVSEADIGVVAEGQRAFFQVDAHRDRRFEGEVIQVRNSPKMEDNVVHYETIIAVDNREQLLKPGMTTEVEIITAEKQDVMRVRNTALRARLPDNIRPADPDDAFEDGRTVYKMQNGALSARSVRTGLTDGVYTEIIEGVSSGDSLAVGLSLRAQQDEGRRSFMTGDQAQY